VYFDPVNLAVSVSADVAAVVVTVYFQFNAGLVSIKFLILDKIEAVDPVAIACPRTGLVLNSIS
jgi:hypothetical protein